MGSLQILASAMGETRVDSWVNAGGFFIFRPAATHRIKMPERTSTADATQDGNRSVGCRRRGGKVSEILYNAVKQKNHTETFQARDVTSLVLLEFSKLIVASHFHQCILTI